MLTSVSGDREGGETPRGRSRGPWSQMLRGLRTLLEKGKAIPHKHESLQMMEALLGRSKRAPQFNQQV